jgi:sugar transferase (PEP-CTERM system associated)
MMKFLPTKQLALLAGDIALIGVSFYLAPVLRFGVLLDPSMVFDAPDVAAVFVYLLMLYIFDFYNLDEKPEKPSFLLQFLLAVIIVNLIIASLFYLFHFRPYSTIILVISGSWALVFLILWRFVFLSLFVYAAPQRILILGAGAAGKSLCNLLKPRHDLKIAGFVDDDPDKQNLIIDGYGVIGPMADLMKTIKDHNIDLIVVAVTTKRSVAFFQKLVEAKFSGVNVYEMPTFFEEFFGTIPVLHTTNMWLGFADISGVKRNIYNTKLKKIFDKTMAVIGLIIALPIMLLIVLLIKMESCGPVLYYQTRVGWGEKPFGLIKFRSMKIDAEVNGAVWAQENDPRVTGVGKVIRLLRIDELPQLWNVLKGEMSFVGPRPERPEFVENLKKEIPFYSLRHSIRPGITGWAQVNYPYGATVKDALAKLEYDLYYIKNVILPLDLIIIARTVRTVLFGKGAR